MSEQELILPILTEMQRNRAQARGMEPRTFHLNGNKAKVYAIHDKKTGVPLAVRIQCDEYPVMEQPIEWYSSVHYPHIPNRRVEKVEKQGRATFIYHDPVHPVNPQFKVDIDVEIDIAPKTGKVILRSDTFYMRKIWVWREGRWEAIGASHTTAWKALHVIVRAPGGKMPEVAMDADSDLEE